MKNKKRITLADQIKEYLEIPGIGQMITDGCDLILRLRMAQPDIANTIISKYIKSKTSNNKINLFRNPKFSSPLRYLCDEIKVKPVNINEPLYKAIELGEYVKCYQENRMCEDVDQCWITRKGFSKCKEKI